MILVINILLIVLLVLIAMQDIRERAVSLFLLIGTSVFAIMNFYLVDNSWASLGLNILFILILVGSLFLYISIKNRKFTNIFLSHFGIGDVFFLLAITPLFSPRNLVFYIIFGMLFSLLLHLILTVLLKQKMLNSTVPLAGYLSVFLVFIIVFSSISSTNLLTNNIV